MGVFKNSKGSLCTMNVLIIKLVVWLGWLSSVAVGQLELSESITGFVNFPEVGISSIGNLAVLITSISKGRLDLEMGVRDVLATVRGPKLHKINEVGLATSEDYKKASVVMLSSSKPNSSVRQFMKYISNVHHVHSILLPFKSFKSAQHDEKYKCNCDRSCKCIIFGYVEEVTNLLAPRMPRGFRVLDLAQCLLPCGHCLIKGCHHDTPEVERIAEDDSEVQHVENDQSEEVEFPPFITVPDIGFLQKKHTCICIPVHRAADDVWTKLLTKSFRSKDTEERKVSVKASDAMEHYTAQDGDNTYRDQRRREWLRKGLIVEFHSISLILPRLVEILVNFLLVGWFRVDGFSTSMVARKAVKKYVVGSNKSGFAANAFLSRALVKSNDNGTHVCQVLTFRGCFLSLGTLSCMAGAVNLICAIFWAVCTALEVKWYVIDSVAPSKPRVVAIIIVIGFAFLMDCWHLYLVTKDSKKKSSQTPETKTKMETKESSQKTEIETEDVVTKKSPQTTENETKKSSPTTATREGVVMVLAVMLVEITCVVLGILGAVGIWGKNHVFGKWVYSGVQALVWVKWGIGSYLLGESSPAESNSEYNWGSGVLVYSSAFLLNSGLAAVRCKWKYLPSN